MIAGIPHWIPLESRISCTDARDMAFCVILYDPFQYEEMP
jgi:hypothetical protein